MSRATARRKSRAPRSCRSASARAVRSKPRTIRPSTRPAVVIHTEAVEVDTHDRAVEADDVALDAHVPLVAEFVDRVRAPTVTSRICSQRPPRISSAGTPKIRSAAGFHSSTSASGVITTTGVSRSRSSRERMCNSRSARCRADTFSWVSTARAVPPSQPTAVSRNQRCSSGAWHGYSTEYSGRRARQERAHVGGDLGRRLGAARAIAHRQVVRPDAQAAGETRVLLRELGPGPVDHHDLAVTIEHGDVCRETIDRRLNYDLTVPLRRARVASRPVRLFHRLDSLAAFAVAVERLVVTNRLESPQPTQ